MGVHNCTNFILFNKIYHNDATHLYLSDKGLKFIPNQIKYFTQLKHLELCNNNITEIPDFIFELKNLEYLGLSGNFITVLPHNMKKLEKLKIFKLNNNQLQYISGNIFTAKLEILYLYDNPCKECKIYAKTNCNNVNMIRMIHRKNYKSIIDRFFKTHVLPKYFKYEWDYLDIEI